MLGDLAFALRMLTILPLPPGRAALGPATLFFPLVGLLLGGAVASLTRLVAGSPAPIPALVAVILLAALGAGRSLRGLAHLGDALTAGRDRGRALALLEREWIGPAGWALAALALAAKLLALDGAAPVWSLVFAPMLGRWGMVVVAFSARLARAGSPGPRFEAGITFREFGWASVLAGGAALVAIDAVGLLAMLAVAAVTVTLRLLAHRWLGGITAAIFWASAELGEIASLIVLAAFVVR